MSQRRILSLWFPRLAAERVLRLEPAFSEAPFAVVEVSGNAQVLGDICARASAAGLRRGQPLRDARAMCADLRTRLASPLAEKYFLHVLQRWAGKFSPWVSSHPPASLLVDLTGCAHLFGGEEGLISQLEQDCRDLGLSMQAGIADTVGAAWALARYAGQEAAVARSGDAIDQEAYATRSRAAKRRGWEKGVAPQRLGGKSQGHRIAPIGQTRTALAGLPVAALRLESRVTDQLIRLGLRQIGDLTGQPRAALARRFGKALVLRLDQAFGTVPEPVSPAKPPTHFGVRLTLPEPIGLEDDLVAGLDRLLPELEKRLKDKGMGVRRLRFEALRCDHTRDAVEVGLARPSANPDRLRPLIRMKLPEIDAGPGIDGLRLLAAAVEPVHPHQHKGHLKVAAEARAGHSTTALDDLVGRLGAKIGLEEITRLAPGESHIPEKASQVLAAAWSDPVPWPGQTSLPRPLVMFPPEPITASEGPHPPDHLRWRRRDMAVLSATGPERITPEWWLDDPAWRSGPRDYWWLETDVGERLWAYYAHGGEMSAGWFCQGVEG